MQYIYSILEVLAVMVPVLMGVAFVTIAERKGMGSMQRRLGPNIVGIWGLLQPFADALKLIIKENIVPVQSNKWIFYLGPIITLIFSLLGWGIIPFGPNLVLGDLSLGIIYTLCISSLTGYGILLAGWAANSKYAFMGSLRSTAQIISYELVLSSVIICVLFFTGSFNYMKLIEYQEGIWFIIPLLPLFIIFFIGAVCETNRAPMDLAEAESELTAGFFTEHSSTIFVFFFLAEYANLILISSLSIIFFWGGYLTPFMNIISYIILLFNPLYYGLIFTFITNFIYSLVFGLKVIIIIFLFIWLRASFPRIRYDQLMQSCWTIILPIAFAFILFIPCIIYSFDWFVPNL